MLRFRVLWQNRVSVTFHDGSGAMVTIVATRFRRGVVKMTCRCQDYSQSGWCLHCLAPFSDREIFADDRHREAFEQLVTGTCLEKAATTLIKALDALAIERQRMTFGRRAAPDPGRLKDLAGRADHADASACDLALALEEFISAAAAKALARRIAPAAALNQIAEHQHIVGLDMVRFVSAVMVMMFHLAYWSWAGGGTIARLMPNLPSFPELTPVAWLGWVGVEIFFVLSGFVIAYSSEGQSAFGFLRSRFVRLMPGVWICASLVFAVLLVGQMVPFKQLSRHYLESLVLIPKRPWIDPVYWSLCVEIFFYGLVLCLLIANRFRKIELIMGAIGIVSALVWIMFGLSLFLPGIFGSHISVLERIQYSWKLQLLLIHHGCLFALGVYLWLLLFKGVTPGRLIIAAVCFIGGYLETLWAGKEQILEGRMNFPTMLPPALWGASILLIIASIVINDRASTWAGARARTIRMLGLMSYPLYLFHQTIGNAVVLALHDRGMPRFLALFFAVAICLAISWIIAAALEPGVKRYLQFGFSTLEGWLGRGARSAFLLRATTDRVAFS
jgi:peptidoglycan/LPS O-acetylase OafA/YrhL